jgi:tRNA(adenine34) deaminase
MTDNQAQSHEFFMGLALEQATIASNMGEVPVGAVLVKDGEVIGTGHNHPIGLHDPSAHAEIQAIRMAAKKLGNYRLVDCDLYVTLEPCVMCSGAIMQSRLSRVVFGARDPKIGAAGSLMNLFDNESLNHQTSTIPGVLEAQCVQILQDFFKQRRLEKKQSALQS